MIRYFDAAADIRGRLGMVVPTWYPDDAPDAAVAALLASTLADVEAFCQPEHVALVVDGQPRVTPLARAAAERLGRGDRGPHVIARSRNGGKGAAVREGLDALLADTPCQAFVVRDADADHDIHDVAGMFRLLHQMLDQTGVAVCLVVGARADRRRPMGAVRGEMEFWVVDFLWHAVQFVLAREGRGVDSTFLGPYGFLPDFLSGYKLYSRAAAETAARGIARAQAEHPDLDMGRFGPEVVPVIEVLLSGGVVGQRVRGTFEGQPCSGFAGFDPMRIYPSRLLWMARRMGLGGAVALRLFDNAVARSPLSTDAGLADHFGRMRRMLAEGLGFDPPPATVSAFC